MAKQKTNTPIKLIITRTTKLSVKKSMPGGLKDSVVSLYSFVS